MINWLNDGGVCFPPDLKASFLMSISALKDEISYICIKFHFNPFSGLGYISVKLNKNIY